MNTRLLVYLAVSISTICEIVDMGFKWSASLVQKLKK